NANNNCGGLYDLRMNSTYHMHMAAARLAAAGSTTLVLAPRQAAARGVVAGSMAVHGCTGSWLAARLTAPGPTADLSTAAGPTACGLAAGGHTSRFAAGGFSGLTASLGAGGRAAAGLTAGGLAAGGHTNRLEAGGPTVGGLAAGGHTGRFAAGGPTAGGLAADGPTRAGSITGGLEACGPTACGPAAGRLAATGAAGVGHGLRVVCGFSFRGEVLVQILVTSSILVLLYTGLPGCEPISRFFLIVVCLVFHSH
ncbi:hypothetical protein FD754_007771, partial [Muntiacus muntjak]